MVDLKADYKVQVQFLEGDLAKRAEVQALAEKAIELGGVDILVNNAGIQVLVSFISLALMQHHSFTNLYPFHV